MDAALAGRIGLLITFAAAAVALDTSIYTGVQVLDPSFILYWKVDQPTSTIRFAVKGNTTGFVGLGISEVGAMLGSDLMIGTVANGSALVGDYFAFGRSTTTVRPDSQQDVQTISGSETTDANGTWTVLEFSRKLNTNDTNDRPIVEGINQVIWALGPSDNLGYHGVRRGGSQVVFFGGLPISPIPLTGLETVNLTAPAYKVPTNFTTYACNVYNLTSLGKKRHVIAFEAIIDTNAPAAVHHTTVSSCTPQEVSSSMRGKTPNEHCERTAGCSRITFVWAVGGKTMYMPPDVGLPIGPGTDATILVMQIHYTNPEARSDIVDRSGMRFYLSPTLRSIDAGMVPLGPYTLSQIRIPPGIPGWVMTSTCRGGCTNKNIRSSITVFASMLHQHTAGSQVLTTVLRDGKEIASLGEAEYYDFDFQQTVTLPKPVTVLPSDALRTTCIWDTTKRMNVTEGGESTQEEMCKNFVYYYPAQANLTGGCLDACLNNNYKNGNPFHPYIGFPGTSNQGYVLEVCGDNDRAVVDPPILCEFGPMNGQNWTGQRKFGQQSRSLSALSVDMITKLQVKAAENVSVPNTVTPLAPPPPKRASAEKLSREYMLSSLFILFLGTLVHFL